MNRSADAKTWNEDPDVAIKRCRVGDLGADRLLRNASCVQHGLHIVATFCSQARIDTRGPRGPEADGRPRDADHDALCARLELDTIPKPRDFHSCRSRDLGADGRPRDALRQFHGYNGDDHGRVALPEKQKSGCAHRGAAAVGGSVHRRCARSKNKLNSN